MRDATSALTGSDVKILGTLKYIAPEQLQRQHMEVDARADIYSLGATLYEVSTGKPFLDGQTESRLVKQVLQEEPVAPRRAERRLPRDLATVIQVATDKRVDRRYATARELEQDLRAVAEHRPIKARAPGPLYRLSLLGRRHPALVAVAATVLLLALGGGMWRWDATRIKVGYFAAYADRRGVYEGAYELKSYHGRARTVKVLRRGGRVVALHVVNGRGHPVENEAGDASITFAYGADGRPVERVYRRRNGRVRQKHRLSLRGNTLQASVVDHHDLRASLDGTDVALYRVTYDSAGHPRRIMYFNDRGAPRANREQAYGFELQTDSHGLVTVKSALSPSGNLAPTRGNVARMVYRRDRQGNVLELRYQNRQGQPTLTALGHTGWRARFDSRGNRIAKTYLGLDCKATSTRAGYASWKKKRDAHGMQEWMEFLDPEGEGMLDSRRVAAVATKRDDRGNPTEEAYYGLDGRSLTLCKWRYATVQRKFDTRGNVTEERYLGLDRQPILNHKGVAGKRMTYDQRGNRTRTEYLGKSGYLTKSTDGAAIVVNEYDDRGLLVEASWYDTEARLTVTRFGLTTVRSKYDDRGHRVQKAYYGVDGGTAADGDGTSELATVRDAVASQGEAGRLTALLEPHPLDLGGKFLKRPLVLNKNGVAIECYAYDEYGNVVEVAYFGRDRRLKLSRSGYAIRRTRYDRRGNKILRRYFGTREEPVEMMFGVAMWKHEYDSLDREIRLTAYGVDYLPKADKDGYAMQEMKYDALGRLASRTFFGPDCRMPVENTAGYHRVEFQRDATGQVIGKVYRDRHGKQVGRSRIDRHRAEQVQMERVQIL